MTDFIVADHGSIVLLLPRSPEARDWVAENLPSDAPRLGNSIGIERRYFEPIYYGIVNDGLTIS